MKVRKWLLVAAAMICLEGIILTGMFFILPGGKVYGEMEYRAAPIAKILADAAGMTVQRMKERRKM